jgi:hypothetical protein
VDKDAGEEYLLTHPKAYGMGRCGLTSSPLDFATPLCVDIPNNPPQPDAHLPMLPPHLDRPCALCAGWEPS